MARWRAGDRHPEAGGRVSGSDVCRGSEERRSLLLEEGQHFLIDGVARVVTCPCSSQRIARHGVGLPGRRGMLEEVRGKAVVVASLNAGTGLVPAILDSCIERW